MNKTADGTQISNKNNAATVGVNNKTNVNNFVILKDLTNSNVSEMYFILDGKVALDNTDQIDHVP